MEPIVIVGAGPAGLSLHEKLCESGIKSLIIERKKSVGEYGNRVINLDTFKLFGSPEEIISYKIDEVVFSSPSGEKLRAKKERGYVINKRDLELCLLDRISEPNIVYGKAVIKLNKKKKKLLTSDGTIFSYSILVGCDGVHSTVRSSVTDEQIKTINCYAEEYDGQEPTTVFVEPDLAKGFYGWIMPLSDKRIEIGIGSVNRGVSQKELFHILKKKHGLDKYSRSLKITGGTLPVDFLKREVYSDIVLIGDASGGEPAMGGSLHKTVDEVNLLFNILSEKKNLEEYDILWNGFFLEEFKTQRKLRNAIDSATEKDIDKVFKKLHKKRLPDKGLVTTIFKEIALNLEK